MGDYGGGGVRAALLAHAGLTPQGAWPGDQLPNFAYLAVKEECIACLNR